MSSPKNTDRQHAERLGPYRHAGVAWSTARPDAPARHEPAHRCVLLLAVIISLVCVRPAAGQIALETYNSRRYTVHTNLTKPEARGFARHMDRVFDAYQKRFSNIGLTARDDSPMDLYLLRRQDQYEQYLAEQGINASNSGGMFVVRRDFTGLATFVQGRPVSETCAVLQHEGFHQFAFNYIGPDLPIWVNEGLAQYFEDGIFVKHRLVLDLANAHRVESVKAAVRQNRTIPFEQMLSMSDKTWSSVLRSDTARASMQYDQAWSMVYFLGTAQNGQYVEPFRRYLKAVAQGMASSRAFAEAFGSDDPKPFYDAWRRWAARVEPDDLNVVLTRMNFLGHALRFLDGKEVRTPRSTTELRSVLQRMGYRVVWSSHGLSRQMSAQDETIYRYPLNSRTNRMFQLLEPARADLPPRIAAPGMRPEPTLMWTRDADGMLMQEVVFR